MPFIVTATLPLDMSGGGKSDPAFLSILIEQAASGRFIHTSSSINFDLDYNQLVHCPDFLMGSKDVKRSRGTLIAGSYMTSLKCILETRTDLPSSLRISSRNYQLSRNASAQWSVQKACLVSVEA